jgi:hypothetical protein
VATSCGTLAKIDMEMQHRAAIGCSAWLDVWLTSFDQEPDFFFVFSSGSFRRAKNASSSHSPFILRQTRR